jgi:inosine-uridine nucleoside N-ribohydrolase
MKKDFKNNFVFIIILLILIAFSSFNRNENNNSKAGTEPRTPVKIIFDTDISGDYDDVGATATLLSLSNKGEAEILAMGVSAGGYAAKWGGRCLDAVNTYYGQPDIPLGVVKNIGSTSSAYLKEIAENWPNDLKPEDIWDASTLYRKVLSEQPDTSVVIVSVGYMTNIKDLLQSKPDKYSDLDGIALVKKKAKKWVCMGGEFPEGNESNFWSEPEATKYAVEHWPRPVLFCGVAIGTDVATGSKLVRCSYKNPIRRVYEIGGGYVGRTHPSWDQTAVLAAVRNPLQYWDIETQGYCTIISDDAGNEWKMSPDKNHSYLINKPDSKLKVTEVIDDLMTDVAPPYSEMDKVVLNLKFNENLNDLVQDASGNGHTGILMGNYSYVNGKYGNALAFDKNSKCLFIDKDENIFGFEDLHFTVSLWVKYPEAVPFASQLLFKNLMDRNKWMGIYKNASDNTIGFMVKNDSVSGKTPVTAGKWYHIGITLSTDSASIYINGKLDAVKQIDIEELWGLGTSGYRLSSNVGGEKTARVFFDDLFIFKDALSQQELNEVMSDHDKLIR